MRQTLPQFYADLPYYRTWSVYIDEKRKDELCAFDLHNKRN